eukprot:7864753-Pyramimonas_sp.AAC.1
MRFLPLFFRGIPARQQGFKLDAANVRGGLIIGSSQREMHGGILVDIVDDPIGRFVIHVFYLGVGPCLFRSLHD